MQCAVATSPKVSISAHGIQIPSLFDSGSDVTLLRQSYFEKDLLPKIKLVMSKKANTHKLFNLTVTKDSQLLTKMYTELDITFLGLKVPNVGVLVIGDQSQMLDKKHQSKLPHIIVWNLVWLSYNVFVKKYGKSGFNSFTCSGGVNPVLFFQLCIYHHSDTSQGSGLGVSTKTVSKQFEQVNPPKRDDLSKKKDQQKFWS